MSWFVIILCMVGVAGVVLMVLGKSRIEWSDEFRCWRERESE